MLDIQNLHVDVDGKSILKGLDLSINEGETHALFGQNGSGKTTLVLTIMGFPGYRVTEGRIIQKIEPQYPPLAKSARIQGQVVLAAIISKSGEIENLVLVSGHPLLVPAALEAVRKWRYRPYLLNGEPVEVETTITVNFVLSY